MGLKDFSDRYSDNIYKFKKRWLTKAGSIEAARRMKPPKWKAGDDAWQKLIDFRARPDRLEQSERNSKNISKNKVTTYQGSKSFTQGRYEFVWFFIIFIFNIILKVFILFICSLLLICFILIYSSKEKSIPKNWLRPEGALIRIQTKCSRLRKTRRYM